jgi:hypothetical protein
MRRIVLSEEQARLLSLTEDVEICDPQGRVITSIPAELTAEQYARIKRAREQNGPRVSSEQVRQMLRALEEAWEREGPFDEARALEIAKQVREGRGGS